MSLGENLPLARTTWLNRLIPRIAILVICGTLLMTVSAYVVVPMVPVPITMQTLAVKTIGALYEPRLGFATILIWLGLGAAGLPDFAGGGGGASRGQAGGLGGLLGGILGGGQSKAAPQDNGLGILNTLFDADRDGSAMDDIFQMVLKGRR